MITVAKYAMRQEFSRLHFCYTYTAVFEVI
jgi:hypothetical protein